VPDHPGRFAGRVLHSGHYRNPGDLDGERVLVVGAGNSGCDVAVDAAQAGRETYVSVRNGLVFQPKTLCSAGLRHAQPARNRPVVNGQLLHFVHHGRVRVTPGIARLDGHDVHFTDGSVRTVDTIVYATGFKASLPFLDPALLPASGGVPLRVAGMTLPLGVERLSFVGLAAPRGPQLPVSSAQARLIAKFLAAQERSAIPLSAIQAKRSRPEARIDIPRHEWQRDMDRAHRRIDRVLRRGRTPADAPRRAHDYVAIHG